MVQQFSGCRTGRLKAPKGRLKTPQESGRLPVVFSLKSACYQLTEQKRKNHENPNLQPEPQSRRRHRRIVGHRQGDGLAVGETGRGGGVVFGPRGNENYTITLPKHEKRTALRQALSLANQAGKLHVLPYEDKVTGKTKDAAAFLEQQGFDRKTLLVASKKTPELMRSTNNLQNVLVLNAMYLSVYHILNADHIVLSPEAVEIVTAWLGKEEV